MYCTVYCTVYIYRYYVPSPPSCKTTTPTGSCCIASARPTMRSILLVNNDFGELPMELGTSVSGGSSYMHAALPTIFCLSPSLKCAEPSLYLSKTIRLPFLLKRMVVSIYIIYIIIWTNRSGPPGWPHATRKHT